MNPIHNIYIEKHFVDKLIHKVLTHAKSPLLDQDESEAYNNCYNFIKKLIFVNIFTDISEDELNDTGKHYKYLINRGNTLPFVRPAIFLNIYNYASELNLPGFTLFFSENKNDLKNNPKLCHLFLSCDDIKFKWAKIFEYSLRTFPLNHEFINNWRFIDNIKHPLNTIIIVDPYLKSNLETLNINLRTLLASLFKNYVRSTRLDIVLFFDITLSNKQSGKSNITCEVFFEWVQELLFSENIDTYNLVFRDSKALNISNLKNEHNRFIITNYWKIKSGRSFDFLDSNGSSIGSHDDLTLSFVFDPKVSNSVISDIERLNSRFYTDSNDFIDGKLYNRLTSFN